MLIRRRNPARRPSRSRSSENHDGRRTLPLEGWLPGSHPLRLNEKNRSLTEDIPHTPGGVDKLRVPGIAFDLLPQVTDVHVDRALVAELVAPHPREQGAAREDPARVGGERHQKLELRVRKVDLLAAHGDRLGHVVVCPKLQANDPVYLVVLRREHDYGHIALRPDSATHLRAVDL